MPKCFTCVNKITANVSPEERKRWRKIVGAFKTSELIFICAKSGLRIQQIDPACEQFESGELMTQVADSLSDFAKKMRKEMEG